MIDPMWILIPVVVICATVSAIDLKWPLPMPTWLRWSVRGVGVLPVAFYFMFVHGRRKRLISGVVPLPDLPPDPVSEHHAATRDKHRDTDAKIREMRSDLPAPPADDAPGRIREWANEPDPD